MLKYLVETFGYNRPFKISEVKYDKCARSRRYTLISELCKKGKLVRFEKGIYYIPKTTKFGVIPFDPMTVIEKKYVKVGDCAMGYFAGSHLLYMLGLSKTRANTIDVFTNNETKDSKIVFIGGKRVRLHTTRTTVDKWNVSVLCFLELMNGIDTETLDEHKRKLITDYITENRITQKQITKYIPYFPDKTCRNLIESEVIYRVPQ